MTAPETGRESLFAGRRESARCERVHASDAYRAARTSREKAAALRRVNAADAALNALKGGRDGDQS